MPPQLQSYLEGLGKHDLESAGPASDHYLILNPNVHFSRKVPLSQSALQPNSTVMGSRESASTSHLSGRPRFTPSASGESANRDGEVPLCRIYLQSPVVSGYITAGIVDELPVDGVSLVLGNVTVENMPGQTAPSTNHGNPPDPMPPKVSPVCVVTRSASRRMASNAPSEPHPSKTTIDPVVHCIEGTPVTRSTLIAEQARDPQLKALKECFLDESAAVPLAAYVKRFRERMCIAQRVASENLQGAQVKMKAHYDQTHKVQSREFHPGDQVLVFLPLHLSPFQSSDTENNAPRESQCLLVSSGHEESVDAVVDPVLRNSEVLQNPERNWLTFRRNKLLKCYVCCRNIRRSSTTTPASALCYATTST
ncbi:hypothetical protein O3P69_014786 [Scylla paramamosain]|uniref:Uncharacterized protein n=1 Tax=Scylla paramamosain TaxID=85552 RepID=A0AAW0TZC2_SCYPA